MLSCCAQELVQFMRLLKASIQQSSTVLAKCYSAARGYGNNDLSHACHIFQRELELDAATMFTGTDSASTRLSLNGKQTWCEDKLRHVGTSPRYFRDLVRHENVAIEPAKGTESCLDTLTKGHKTTTARVNEFHRLARLCHGFSSQHSADCYK